MYPHPPPLGVGCTCWKCLHLPPTPNWAKNVTKIFYTKCFLTKWMNEWIERRLNILFRQKMGDDSSLLAVLIWVSISLSVLFLICPRLGCLTMLTFASIPRFNWKIWLLLRSKHEPGWSQVMFLCSDNNWTQELLHGVSKWAVCGSSHEPLGRPQRPSVTHYELQSTNPNTPFWIQLFFLNKIRSSKCLFNSIILK